MLWYLYEGVWGFGIGYKVSTSVNRIRYLARSRFTNIRNSGAGYNGPCSRSPMVVSMTRSSSAITYLTTCSFRLANVPSRWASLDTKSVSVVNGLNWLRFS
jgi:hypothetical protein